MTGYGMALKEDESFKLFTVQQVAELFPAADERKKQTAHIREVEALVLAHGHYRKFGEQVLLTRSDIRALIRAISNNSRASDGVPAGSSDGYLVTIGSRTDDSSNVFIGWAALGCVDSLVGDVSSYADWRVELLDYAPMTYGEYVNIRDARLKKHRDYGCWYYREPPINALFRELFTARELDETEEQRGTSENVQ